jgi:hypothetical protein
MGHDFAGFARKMQQSVNNCLQNAAFRAFFPGRMRLRQ